MSNSDTSDTLGDRRILAGVAVLASLPPAVVAGIEELCQWDTFQPGAWVFERGQDSNHVFFVVDGVVRVLNYSANGRVVRFASVGPGGLFGELAAIDGLPRSATVVADRPCVVARLAARRPAPLRFVADVFRARPAPPNGGSSPRPGGTPNPRKILATAPRPSFPGN